MWAEKIEAEKYRISILKSQCEYLDEINEVKLRYQIIGMK